MISLIMPFFAIAEITLRTFEEENIDQGISTAAGKENSELGIKVEMTEGSNSLKLWYHSLTHYSK